MMKYIMALDDVISKEFCDHLIDKFHKNQNVWKIRDDEFKRFNEINLTENPELYAEENDILQQIFYNCTQYYASQFPSWQFPKTDSFESIRMKHYPAGQGEFKPHVDASHWDSMRRFLVFFLYLDEGEGGETILFDQEVKVERKPGRLLMFPPVWTFPHAGAMPIGTDKHIIGSYLHHQKPENPFFDV